MGHCFQSWYNVSNTLEMCKISFHICLSKKKKKRWLIRDSVSLRTWSVSSKKLDYVKSQEEAGFKGNSSNICALVIKGGERLFIHGMWPVGREGCRPGEGLLWSQMDLDGKEDARESQAAHAILGALHKSLFFHSVPVLMPTNVFVDRLLKICRLLKLSLILGDITQGIFFK